MSGVYHTGDATRRWGELGSLGLDADWDWDWGWGWDWDWEFLKCLLSQFQKVSFHYEEWECEVHTTQGMPRHAGEK
jgi:hypothetical protein